MSNNEDIVTKFKTASFDILYKQVLTLIQMYSQISNLSDIDRKKSEEEFQQKLILLKNTIQGMDTLIENVQQFQEGISTSREIDIEKPSVPLVNVTVPNNNEEDNNLNNVDEATGSVIITEPHNVITADVSSELPLNSSDQSIATTFTRNSNNPVKVIVVNSLQFDNLNASRVSQTALLDFGALATSEKVVSGALEKTNLSIEEMLEQASILYKEGRFDESEALYQKIRESNDNNK